MLRVIVGAVGGFIFGAVATAGLMFTLTERSHIDNETWILVAAIGGGALSAPTAVIAATWTLLNAMRALARGHVEGWVTLHRYGGRVNEMPEWR
jgi:hypothetical protein